MNPLKKSISVILCISVIATLLVSCGKRNSDEDDTKSSLISSSNQSEDDSLSNSQELSSVEVLSSVSKSDLAANKSSASSAASKSAGTVKPSSVAPSSAPASKSAAPSKPSEVSMDGMYAHTVAQWDDQFGLSYHRITDIEQKVKQIEFVSATVNGVSCTMDKCNTESQISNYVKEMVEDYVENPSGDYITEYNNFIADTIGEDAYNLGKPIGLVMLYYDREKAEQKATEFSERDGLENPVHKFIIKIKVTMMDGTVGNFEHRIKWDTAEMGGYFYQKSRWK